MRLRSFSAFASLVVGIGLLGACGSRTGLFGEDTPLPFEPDAAPQRDGARDADMRPDGAVACVPGRFQFDLATAQLMFVVDRSGSMAFALDGRRPNQLGNLPPGVSSRWDTLRDALFQTITPFDSQLAMGAKFFPEEQLGGGGSDEEACSTATGVGIPPARGNVSSIIDVFDTTTPIGGTPTAEAVRLAAQYLAGSRTVARTMILATDGAPNCNENLSASTCTCTSATGQCAGVVGGELNCLDDGRTIGAIRSAFQDQKIPVYVIGIGSTERPDFLQVLDDMAVAGGRPRSSAPFHYNVQTSAELKAALQSIGDSISKCTYLTPSAPTDPNAIAVEIGGASIPRDVTHTDGWDWVDQAFGTLQFFGTSCTAASSGSPGVTGVVTCQDD
ncbi:MAG: hypothetical protein JWP97_5856 [Labilithrix sp.]|nr:hypothetical protein [Labilithrix sp.]